MPFETTVVFDTSVTANANEEVSVAAAWDVPVGAYIQVSDNTELPYTSEGMNLHPDYEFIFESIGSIGMRGNFIIDTSWGDGQAVTQEMLDTFLAVVNQSYDGSNAHFGLTQVDFAERTVKFALSVPPQPELGWRGRMGLKWGLAPAKTRRMTWASPSHYLCYLLIDSDWRSWTTMAMDVAPHSSVAIDRVEGASSVYLIFSEDVITSTGTTLSRGVAYSQVSETLEVTAGSEDTLIIRVSK